MEAYSQPLQQDLAAEVAALPDEQLKLLLRYFHTRQGPGLDLVKAECQKRHILTPTLPANAS